MDFLYGGAFRTELPEAYERLILDCLLGDATLFTRADEVDEQWALVDSIVAALEAASRTSFPNYDAGTWGPPEADELLRAGRARMAKTLKDTSVAEIEAWLDRQRDDESRRSGRASLTHMAWMPRRVVARGRARDARPGRRASLRGRCSCIPSRRGRRRLRRVDRASSASPAAGHGVCAEIVRIRLRGSAAEAPASVVVPLQLPDLPVFLRWRGRPPFGRPPFEQLVGVADRLIVDSREWERSAERAREAGGVVRPRRRLRPRVGADAAAGGPRLADRWPGIKQAKTAPGRRPAADAVLLRAWLRSRLRQTLPAEPRRRRQACRASRSTARSVPPARGLPCSPERPALRPSSSRSRATPCTRPRSDRCDVIGRRRRISGVHVVAEVPSFESVAERHLDDVHAYLVYLTRDRELAEELTAETFERALRQWRRFDPQARERADVALPARAHDRARPLPRRGAPPPPRAARTRRPAERGRGRPLRRPLARARARARGAVGRRARGDRPAHPARPRRSRPPRASSGSPPTACTTRLSRALKKLEERMSADVAA